MHVLLVLPWHQTDRSYRSRFSTLLTYAPLTIGTLSAIIKDERPEWKVTAYDEISKKVNYEKEHFDLVLISAVTPVIIRAYEIAEEFQKRGSYVVIGGYHATYNPEEVMRHADTVITGPADLVLRDFIRDYEKHQPQKLYQGGFVSGEDILPVDRSIINMKKYLKYPTIIANRGCPNHCAYCSISDMWRESVPRPIADVIEEIRSLKKKIIVFFDPNFFANRAYAEELLVEIGKLHIRWAGSATINIGFDEEMLELAQKSGCCGLIVGLESLNKATLNNSNKKFVDPSNYKTAIANIQAHKISVNGCFILGMDGDTEEELLDLPAQIEYLNLNLARFAILTPVPNTKLYHEMEAQGRITDTDWKHYTQHKVVYEPIGMTAERLEEIYRYVWKETFTFRRIFRRINNIKHLGLLEKLVLFGANIGFKYLGME